MDKVVSDIDVLHPGMVGRVVRKCDCSEVVRLN